MRPKTPQKRVQFVHTLRVVILGVFAVFIGLVGLSLFHPAQTSATTSSYLNFQARLENATGSIVPDGYYNVEFKLYNASSSSGSSQGSCTGDAACLWTEDYTYNSGPSSTDARIRVANGYLTVNLGSLTVFGSINWNQQMWLTMRIGGTSGVSTSWDTEMFPRIQLTAVPYAFQAGELGNGTNKATLDSSGNLTLQQTSTISTSTGQLTVQGATSLVLQSTTSSAVTLDSGTTGTVNVGTGANSKTIQLGATNSAITDTINIGNNGNASGISTITIGSTNSTSSLLLQAGTGNLQLQTQGGTLGIGNNAVAQTIAIGNTTGATTVTLQAGSGGIGLQNATTVSANFTVTGAGSVAYQKGSDFSAPGTTNNASFGSGSLIRLTGASTQTITGIAGGVDGRLLTIVNAAGQTAIIQNLNGGSTGSNQIATGAGGDINLSPGAAISLVYDSGSSLWRVTGGASSASGTYFLEGGNTFGAQGVLGTNDANSLALRTAGTNRLVLDTSGNLQFQQASTIKELSAATGTALTIQGGQSTGSGNNGGDLILQGGVATGGGGAATGRVIVKSNTNNSTSAFQVQDASGYSLLTADTTNSRLGVGINVPLNTFSVAPFDYQTGTATRTNGSATLVGTGTTWTSAMNGDIIVFADGTTNYVGSFTDATHITMANTYTGTTDASPVAYRFYRQGLDVASSGLVGIGITSPDAALSVRTANQNAVVNIYGVGGSPDYGVIQVSSAGSLTNSSNRPLSLQPNNGDVLIATTTDLGAKLSVGGTTLIKTTSSTAFQLQDGSSNSLLVGDTSGLKVGVGATDSTTRFNVSLDVVDAANGSALRIGSNLTSTTNATEGLRVMPVTNISSNSTQGYTGIVAGVSSTDGAHLAGAGAKLVGLQAVPFYNATSGTLAALFGQIVQPINNNTATVNTAEGIYIQTINTTTGTIGTNYGIYIDAPSNGGTISSNYALVTAAGAGNVGIGTLTPTFKLDVTGTTRVNVNSTTAFQVQNGSSISLLNADTANSTVTVRAGGDTRTLGAELYTSGNNFTQASGFWTGVNSTQACGAGNTSWDSFTDSTQAEHCSGNTVALVNTTVGITAGNTYQVKFEIDCNTWTDLTTDTLTVSIGGTNIGSVDGTDCNYANHTMIGTATNTTKLTFTPSTSYRGIVRAVSIKLVSGNYNSVLTVANASGTPNLEVRGSSDTSNTFIGLSAGSNNVSGTGSTAVGSLALQSNISGTDNTALGRYALQASTTGSQNTAIGTNALMYATDAYRNSAIGWSALQNTTIGTDNLGLGWKAGYTITGGSRNVAIGSSSLGGNYNGDDNVAIGSGALGGGGTDLGSGNVAIGSSSGITLNVSTAANNTFLGYDAGSLDFGGINLYFASLRNLQNATAIGAYAQVQQSNSMVLGGVETPINVGIGITMPQNTFSVSPLDANAGTVCSVASSGSSTCSGTSTTFIFGTGTSWNSTMVGDTAIFDDGNYNTVPRSSTIASVTDSTHITLSSAVNLSSGYHYRIHHTGFQVTSAGNAYLQNTSTAAFKVQDASGSAVLAVDTVNGYVGIGTAAPSNPLEVSANVSTNIAMVKIDGSLTASPGGFPAGIQSAPSYTASGTQAGFEAISASASLNGAGTITNLFNLVANPQVTTTSTGTITALTGLFVRTDNNSTAGGTVGTNYGIHISAPITTGTITTSYALVTDSGAGNVGIGTTTPAQTLHISQNSNSSIGIRIENPNTGSAAFGQLELKNSAQQFNVGLGSAGTTQFPNGFFIYDSTNNVARFSISSSGTVRVGVGEAGHATPSVLVLDNKSGSGDPASCTNGGLYYNANSNSFRGCKNGSWVTLVAGVDVQIYNNPANNGGAGNTWTAPSGISVVVVIACGAGGGGGGGNHQASGSNRAGGGGGGGGAYVQKTLRASDVGGSVAVTVGAGGGGGATQVAGTLGGNSSFGTFAAAYGGAGGGTSAALTNTNGAGGGGIASAANATVGGDTTSAITTGVTGGAGAGGGSGINGGPAETGGGSGGGSPSTGGNGAGGTSAMGGGGGGSGGGVAGATNTSQAGGAGGSSGPTGTYGSGGGGGAGGAGTNNGTGGAAGNTSHCGSGGGGGGGNGTNNFSGGGGGAGGLPGGGGGGGGVGTGTGVGGTGGAGGDGEVWVISW